MANIFTVDTDTEAEAIYEFSTASSPINISDTPNVTIELIFDEGTRKLKIDDNGRVSEFLLVVPKKPQNTGGNPPPPPQD